jgi:hypothetical protein
VDRGPFNKVVQAFEPRLISTTGCHRNLHHLVLLGPQPALSHFSAEPYPGDLARRWTQCHNAEVGRLLFKMTTRLLSPSMNSLLHYGYTDVNNQMKTPIHVR